MYSRLPDDVPSPQTGSPGSARRLHRSEHHGRADGGHPAGAGRVDRDDGHAGQATPALAGPAWRSRWDERVDDDLATCSVDGGTSAAAGAAEEQPTRERERDTHDEGV